LPVAPANKKLTYFRLPVTPASKKLTSFYFPENPENPFEIKNNSKCILNHLNF
jgi:hypothetical protein